MDSKKLSARTKQPGHDVTYRKSEIEFIRVAKNVLDPTKYKVVDHPRDLGGIFTDEEGSLGVVPEAAIINLKSGKRIFVEVKKQGPAGNAEERAYKHHTVEFYRLLKTAFGYDYHPFITVFCENLATDRKYTLKIKNLIEKDNYVLWVSYDQNLLRKYLRERCIEWLE